MIGINDISTSADLEQAVKVLSDSCKMIKENKGETEIYYIGSANDK